MRAFQAVGVLISCGVLAACSSAPKEHRPLEKPQVLGVHATDRQGQLTRASVSTKSGELVILEPDGSISTMAVDSDTGRDAFSLTDSDLASLGINLSLDLSHLPDSSRSGFAAAQRKLTAQQRALEVFAARTQPFLPIIRKEPDPENYLAALVQPLDEDGSGDKLVSVTANLVAGVDADEAFAYASCALADWAVTNKAGYARHIRTVSDKGNGKVRIESIYTLSNGSRPLGLQVMTPEDTLHACEERGIPRA